MAIYQRQPAIALETYQRMIQLGLQRHELGVVSISVPSRFAPSLIEMFNQEYQIRANTSKTPGYVKITIWRAQHNSEVCP